MRELQGSGMLMFRDQTILASLPDMCRTLFQKEALSSLTGEEMERLISEVKYRFNADVPQIARILGLGYTEVVNILEKF